MLDLILIVNRTDVPVGSFNPEHPKTSVSDFHYRLFPELQEEVSVVVVSLS